MYYPSFASSSDLSNTMYLEKGPVDLLRPTTVRIIQLDEIPAPPPQPRRLPPSSASSSSASSSEDEDGSEYCSSVDDAEEDEELALARAVEATKMTRILAWRAQFTPLPTTPHPTTLTEFLSRKRSASSSSSNSTPHSKRSRTSASPAPSIHAPRETENNAFLAPPSPTGLARRHTSPRHQPSASLHSPSSTGKTLMVPHGQHHRAHSFSAHADTFCPACDRRFSSKRAFRVHASLGVDGEGAAACSAAVAYSMEACGRSP